MLSTTPSRHALLSSKRSRLTLLGAATLAAALLGSAHSAAAQAFDCPSFGDDRINTETNFGVGCEVRTVNQTCGRR